MTVESFRHIISLGQSCQTIYQINRYYKISHTNFFDNKRTTIELLTNLLNNDFNDLILPANLSISEDREYIWDEKYNFWLKHDFRNQQGMITDNFRDLHPVVKSKFDHLIGKFRKILDSNDTCLFIYFRNRVLFKKYEGVREALELEKAIRNRAPGLSPRILFIDAFEDPVASCFGDFSEAIPYNYDLEEKDSFFQNSRNPFPLERWKGSDLAWDHILKNYRRSSGKLEWLEGYYNLIAKHIRWHKAKMIRKFRTQI
jgi:hypothetical protein